MRPLTVLDDMVSLAQPRPNRIYSIPSATVSRRRMLVGGAATAALVAAGGWPRRAQSQGAQVGEALLIAFGGEAIKDMLKWGFEKASGKALEKFGEDVEHELWTHFQHVYTTFNLDRLRGWFKDGAPKLNLPNPVSESAFMIDPMREILGGVDAPSHGAKNTSVATARSEEIVGKHPSYDQVLAKAVEDLDVIESLAKSGALHARREAMRKVSIGDISSRTVMEPNHRLNHTVTVIEPTGVQLHCSYHIDSTKKEVAPQQCNLLYVGRRGNWALVVYPPGVQKSPSGKIIDHGYRWADARYLGVDTGDGNVHHMYVDEKREDVPGTWDKRCHEDESYVCKGA